MLGMDFFVSLSLLIFAKHIYRPFRAGRSINRYLGLKPQAESYCPLRGRNRMLSEPLKLALMGYFVLPLRVRRPPPLYSIDTSLRSRRSRRWSGLYPSLEMSR
jgi:hypothetical protein